MHTSLVDKRWGRSGTERYSKKWYHGSVCCALKMGGKAIRTGGLQERVECDLRYRQGAFVKRSVQLTGEAVTCAKAREESECVHAAKDPTERSGCGRGGLGPTMTLFPRCSRDFQEELRI